MNRKLFLTIAVLFSSICVLNAQAPDGLSCETAIPVDKSYEGSVPAAGTYYYSVSTYDLPMTCYFYPEESLAVVPKIYADFSCTPGVYDDPNIDFMIKSASGWGVKTPIQFTFVRDWSIEDREAYTLTMDESYRELMALFNITYDVTVNVQFYAPSAGEVRMTPDTLFRSCIENSKWLTMPDVITTGDGHEVDSYVLPFVDWQNDSIRFRWTGTQEPVTVWIGETCDFELKTTGENCALDMFVLNPDAGNEEHIRNYTSEEIQQYISLFGKGGMYYLRTVCAEEGQLILENKPMNEAMRNATQLEVNKSSVVEAYDKDQVYYFPVTWADYSMIWSSSSNGTVTAYFSSDIHFEASEDDANVFAVQNFTKAVSGTELALSRKQMQDICKKADGDHIFVKFVSSKYTSITPTLWGVGSCGENTDELQINDSVTLQKNANSTAWRVDIEKWAKQDMLLYWKGTSAFKAFLGDTCKGYNLNKTNQHVKIYKEISINTDGSRDTIRITQDELLAAAEYADSDGFLYFRFSNSAKGDLIVKATEPVVIESTSVPLAFDSTINVMKSHVDTIYHFTDDWAETDVEFVANKAETIVAYIATTDKVDPEQGNYFAAYTFAVEKNQSRLQFSAKQIASILKKTVDGKIYVAFYSNSDVQVTPKIWNACECVRESYELLLGASEYIPARSQDVVYRINYNQWKDYDVTLYWSGNKSMMAYLAYDCEFNLSADNKYVLNKEDVEIWPNDSIVIGDNVRTRAIDMGLLPEDGFLYFRFYSTSAGTLSTSYATMPIDPCDLVKPFTVPSSLSLNTVEADSVYVFTPSTLIEDSVQFTWSGASELIMHIGTTCALPAEGASIYTLTPNTALRFGTDQLTALAVDGKLYFRFIAKEQANLRIEKYVAPIPVDPCDLVKPFTVPSSLSLNTVEADSVYVFTPSTLIEDSVQFTWSGASELIMHIGTTCALPAEGASIYTLTPNTALRFGKDQLTALAVDGKLYFRFIAKEQADLRIEEYVAPIIEPIKAIALAFDSTINIYAQNVEDVYYFTKEWGAVSVEFEATTDDVIIAYFGLSADFSIFSSENSYKVKFPFMVRENKNLLQLSGMQVSSLLTDNMVDTMYVIFYSSGDTQITPRIWKVNTHLENTYAPKDKAKIYCTREGVVYILVNGERYTLLGEKF